MSEPDDTVRLEGLAGLVDPNPTAYVERYRPPVPPARPRQDPACQWAHGDRSDLDRRGMCSICSEDE